MNIDWIAKILIGIILGYSFNRLCEMAKDIHQIALDIHKVVSVIEEGEIEDEETH